MGYARELLCADVGTGDLSHGPAACRDSGLGAIIITLPELI